MNRVGLTEKKKASNAAWDSKNLKRMSLAMRIDLYERMKAYVDEKGESVNGFIIDAVTEKLNNSEK